MARFKDGAVIGGHVGVNWQWNSFVLGAEGGADWADISGASSLKSLRARAGFSFDKFLLYGTGGAAFQDFGDVGWVAGVGGEYALTSNVSVGVEYLHYDFDRDDANVIRGRVNIKLGNGLLGGG